VLGSAATSAVRTNAGARAGDLIVLTKPLGTGIVTFAAQCGQADASSQAEVGASMAQLNRMASERMAERGAHAATDVTGFGFLSHTLEIARSSQVELEVDFDAIPLFDGVLELARKQLFPGALERNREAVDDDCLDLAGVSAAEQGILFCPETSGGLLVFLPEAQARDYVHELREGGVARAAAIGRVLGPSKKGRIRVLPSARPDVEASHRLPETARAPEPRDGAGRASEGERRSCCDGTPDGRPSSPSNGAASDDPAAPFWAYMKAVSAPGALDVRTKKLIAVALSVANRCEPCIQTNRDAAADAGASPQQINEAVALGIAFGGASSAMLYDRLQSGGP
jgi:AhpD family alkylhydroperoxidase